MKKIGITGGIGSGKSLVAELLQVLGYPVYNADERAKFLINHDLIVKEQILDLFGEKAYLNGNYNSSLIAAMVFDNPELLIKLNGIVHPAVGLDFNRWVADLNNVFPICFKEAALMSSASKKNGLDAVIFVYATEEVRLSRVLNRDIERNTDQIKSIFNKQKSTEQFREIANYEINNNGQMLIIPQLLNILETITS